MKKLADEELSRVLSEHAAGKLQHYTWYSPVRGCGCVAGVVDGTNGDGLWDEHRAWQISEALDMATGMSVSTLVYPGTTDGMLRLLEKAGLA